MSIYLSLYKISPLSYRKNGVSQKNRLQISCSFLYYAQSFDSLNKKKGISTTPLN